MFNSCAIFELIQRVPKNLPSRLATRAKREGVSMNLLITSFLAEGLGKREGLVEKVAEPS